MLEQFKSQHEQLLIEIAGMIETSNLTKNTDRQQLYATISELVEVLNDEASEQVPYAMAVEYFQAYDHAAELLGQRGTSFNSDGTFRANTMRQVHIEALEAILDDTMMDLRAAYRTFEQNAIGSIDTAVKKVQAELASSMVTGNRNHLKRNVMKAFREQGLSSFVTEDGKQLPLDFYASTVVNTKMSQVNTAGHIKRYEDADNDLVQVNARPETCEHCAAHDGMVYSLSGNHPKYPEMTDELKPPYHPNCACGIAPIVEDFLTDSERKVIDERVAKGVDFDPRTDAEKALYARDQRINRRNNAEKKLFMKMQAELGADAPASLGAFRRAKRANTSTYQDLYSRYLSATHTGKASTIVNTANSTDY